MRRRRGALGCFASLATTESGARRNLPENAGRSWSPEEDKQLIAGFDQGWPIEEIAARHHRTRTAITSRLVKLGKLQPDPATHQPVPVG